MGIDHNTQRIRTNTIIYTDIPERRQPQEKLKQSHWKTIGVKVRDTELPLLNRQLDRLNCITLGDLVKDLISGKISRLTDDQQIDILKTNLQTNGQFTVVEGGPYDFYKQIDIPDLQLYLKGKYHEHTARCYLSYFERYAGVFFGLNPEVELFKMNPHKRSWVLQSVKRFGDYYYRKYNNRQVIELVKQIIERTNVTILTGTLI